MKSLFPSFCASAAFLPLLLVGLGAGVTHAVAAPPPEEQDEAVCLLATVIAGDSGGTVTQYTPYAIRLAETLRRMPVALQEQIFGMPLPGPVDGDRGHGNDSGGDAGNPGGLRG